MEKHAKETILPMYLPQRLHPSKIKFAPCALHVKFFSFQSSQAFFITRSYKKASKALRQCICTWVCVRWCPLFIVFDIHIHLYWHDFRLRFILFCFVLFVPFKFCLHRQLSFVFIFHVFCLYALVHMGVSSVFFLSFCFLAIILQPLSVCNTVEYFQQTQHSSKIIQCKAFYTYT